MEYANTLQSQQRMPKIDIGKLIQEEMVRQERSVSWLARKLFCDRTNVYKIFKRTTIDTDLLMRISVVLDCDFFSVYVDAIEELSQGNGGGYSLFRPQEGTLTRAA